MKNYKVVIKADSKNSNIISSILDRIERITNSSPISLKVEDYRTGTMSSKINPRGSEAWIKKSYYSLLNLLGINLGFRWNKETFPKLTIKGRSKKNEFCSELKGYVIEEGKTIEVTAKIGYAIDSFEYFGKVAEGPFFYLEVTAKISKQLDINQDHLLKINSSTTEISAAAKYAKGTRLVIKKGKELFLGTVTATRLGEVFILLDNGEKVKAKEKSKLILGEGIKRKVKKGMPLDDVSLLKVGPKVGVTKKNNVAKDKPKPKVEKTKNSKIDNFLKKLLGETYIDKFKKIDDEYVYEILCKQNKEPYRVTRLLSKIRTGLEKMKFDISEPKRYVSGTFVVGTIKAKGRGLEVLITYAIGKTDSRNNEYDTLKCVIKEI